MKRLLLKTMLLLCALVGSIPSVWAGDTYKLVKNISELAQGDVILITSGTSGSVKAMGAYVTGNNVPAVDITISEETISTLGSAKEITLESKNSAGNYTLKQGAGAYLYAANSSSGSKNYLKTKNDNAVYWSISINTTSYAATVADETSDCNGKNKLRFNSSSSIFSCYSSGQADIYLFKKQASSDEATSVTIDASNITNTDIANGTSAGSFSAVVKNSSSATIDGATVTWSSSKPAVATIDASTGAVTLVKKGTTIITANYAGVDGTYQSSENTYELVVTNSNANDGTAAHPFTPTEARDALDANDLESETEYYVKGYIAKVGTLSNGSLIYWISNDGSMTNSLECFKGKNVGGVDFTEETLVEVGDLATVKGKLKIYQQTYELDQNNEVVSIVSRTKVNIATFTATTTDLAIGGTTNTTVTNDQAGWTPVAYTYASDDENIATVDENGVITAVAKGTANITVTPVVAALDPTYKVGDSKSIEITVHKPSHTATFSVNGVVSSTDYEEDDAIVFPTNPDVLGGRTFVGWAAATIDGTTATAPSFVTSATMGTEDVTYYAVFASSVQADGWQRISPSEISEEGVYALITPSGRAFNGTITSGHGQSVNTAFAFVNGVAETAPTGICELTLAAVEGGYTMYNKDHGYLYATANSSGSLSWHDSESSYWHYTSSNWVYADKSAYLRSYNNTFRTYNKNTNDEIYFAKKTKINALSDFCTTITDESITITTTIGLGTLVSDFALDFTNVAGLEAYIAKENGNKIELEKINKVPAGTGILLRSTNDGADYTVPKATSTDDVTGNIFVRGTGAAVESDPAAGGHNYILSKKGDVYGFYLANGNKVAKNRAYLHTSVAAARIDLNFDNATGINEVKSEKTVEGIFDLQGRKVVTPSKGLYIVNGKKVVIK